MNNRSVITIREIKESEWEEAVDLCFTVFLSSVEPFVKKGGTAGFKNFLQDPSLKKLFIEGRYKVYGAFDRGYMVGVLALRNISHISLLFIESDYQKHGIATLLLKEIVSKIQRQYGELEFTVNASPVAIRFYEKIGFKKITGQDNSEEMLGTPMTAQKGQIFNGQII